MGSGFAAGDERGFGLSGGVDLPVAVLRAACSDPFCRPTALLLSNDVVLVADALLVLFCMCPNLSFMLLVFLSLSAGKVNDFHILNVINIYSLEL